MKSLYSSYLVPVCQNAVTKTCLFCYWTFTSSSTWVTRGSNNQLHSSSHTDPTVYVFQSIIRHTRCRHFDRATHQAHIYPRDFPDKRNAAGSDTGIFPIVARLNHGCSAAFNAVYSWRDKAGQLVVHAIKHIHAGEVHLSLTYQLEKILIHHRKS